MEIKAQHSTDQPIAPSRAGCPADRKHTSWIAFNERDDVAWRICEVCGRWTMLSADTPVGELARQVAAADDTVSGPGFSTTASSGGGLLIRVEDAMADWAAHPFEAAEIPIWRRRNGEFGWFLVGQLFVVYVMLYPVSWAPRPNVAAWFVALLVVLGVDRVRLTRGLRLGGRRAGGVRAWKEAVLVPMLGSCASEINVGVRTGGLDPVTLSDAEAEDALLKILRRLNRFGLDLDWGHKKRKAARASVRAVGGPRAYLAALVAEGERPLRKLGRVEQFALELSLRHVAEERRIRSLIRFVAGKSRWMPKGNTMGEVQGEALPDLVEGGAGG